MSLPRDKAWFAAKTYGYGWGRPLRWQGWAVLSGFIVLLGAGGFGLRPDMHPGYFVAYVVGLGVALTIICWRKGEPARWRWGGG